MLFPQFAEQFFFEEASTSSKSLSNGNLAQLFDTSKQVTSVLNALLRAHSRRDRIPAMVGYLSSKNAS